ATRWTGSRPAGWKRRPAGSSCVRSGPGRSRTLRPVSFHVDRLAAVLADLGLDGPFLAVGAQAPRLDRRHRPVGRIARRLDEDLRAIPFRLRFHLYRASAPLHFVRALRAVQLVGQRLRTAAAFAGDRELARGLLDGERGGPAAHAASAATAAATALRRRIALRLIECPRAREVGLGLRPRRGRQREREDEDE